LAPHLANVVALINLRREGRVLPLFREDAEEASVCG
jgi:hypothetical protein